MSSHTRERRRYDRVGNEDRNSSRNPRHESLKSTPDKGRWDSEFIKFNEKLLKIYLCRMQPKYLSIKHALR